MKFKSIIELTPLLDVFLIIIFAFMIQNKEFKDEQQLELEMSQHEKSMLALALEEKEKQLQQYQQNLDSSQIRILQYEQELSEQKALLENTLTQVEEKMTLFFQEQKNLRKDEKEKGTLAETDYENFNDRLDKIELDPSASFIEQVYVLGELNAYASTISLYLDDSNAIWIEREPTEISLNKFNEETGEFDTELVEAFSTQLTEKLTSYYSDRKKGENKLGEVVLFTYGHSNRSMRGVINIAEQTVANFQKDIQQREGGFRKVFYSNLGYYPFKTTEYENP